VGFVSGRSSGAVRRRAVELGVKWVFQGIRNKAAVYERIKKKTGLKDEQIAYAGDDIGDLAILRAVGLAVTVPDGWPGIRSLVDFVTKARGGRGAVREISELILRAQELRKDLIAKY
jgi:3-deoxy-D-manno-octulosonate 8-phosphate phosphatase (KDO 8-P phosphatase)